MNKRQKKRSFASEVWRRFCKNKLSVFALIVLAVLVGLAIFADYIADYETVAIRQDVTNRLQPRSDEHPLGTDQFGRDIWARIVHGARVSLSIGIVTVFISTAIATVLGGIAGYFGGIVDGIIMRAVDMFIAIPPILLCLAIVASLGVGMINLLIALIIAFIPADIRLVRSTVLTVKDMDYVEAARALGLSKTRIISKHILINCMAPILVNATMGIGAVILTAAGLSFIGLGISPPRPEWGAMLSAGRTFMRTAPHLIFFPGFFIVISVLCINLIGDGLRDALDPRLK